MLYLIAFLDRTKLKLRLGKLHRRSIFQDRIRQACVWIALFEEDIMLIVAGAEYQPGQTHEYKYSSLHSGRKYINRLDCRLLIIIKKKAAHVRGFNSQGLTACMLVKNTKIGAQAENY